MCCDSLSVCEGQKLGVFLASRRLRLDIESLRELVRETEDLIAVGDSLAYSRENILSVAVPIGGEMIAKKVYGFK